MSHGYSILERPNRYSPWTTIGKVHQLSRRSWSWRVLALSGRWVGGKATTEQGAVTAVRAARSSRGSKL